jgi:hypothetical protein
LRVKEIMSQPIAGEMGFKNGPVEKVEEGLTEVSSSSVMKAEPSGLPETAGCFQLSIRSHVP